MAKQSDDFFSSAISAAQGPVDTLVAAYEWTQKHWKDVLAWAGWAALGVGIAIGVFILMLFIRRRLERYLRGKNAQSRTWRTVAADVIGNTSVLFMGAVSVLIGCAIIGLSSEWLDIIFGTIVLIQAGIWTTIFIGRSIAAYAERRTADRVTLVNAMSLVHMLVHVVVWAIVLTIFLSNLGVDVTAMIAGLGIGGIAIGLAAQNIFSDLFASLSIVLDKPFVRGDFIVRNGLRGTVEKIGMKSTRIRSLSGEQVIVSNANLLSSEIRNYHRMRERRIQFSLGIEYHTSYEKVSKVSGLIREAIEQTPNTRFDRAHFQAFGDSALMFEIVYFVLDPDYNKYMDTQQAINLAIMKRFEEEGIVFAFPSRTIYVANAGGAPGVNLPPRDHAANAE